MTVRDARLHVVLGMQPDEWDNAMAKGRATPGWTGLDCSLDPRWHSHPVLGIIGHSHSDVWSARQPHTHNPVVTWGEPVYVSGADCD